MGVERAGHGGDRAGPDLVTAGDQLGELATTRWPACVSILVAVEGEHVAAQKELAGKVILERAQHGVLTAGELGGDVVGELELRPHPVSDARTSSETRLPSARPSTAAIACFIDRPVSLADAAPVSRRPAGRSPQLVLGELGGQV